MIIKRVVVVAVADRFPSAFSYPDPPRSSRSPAQHSELHGTTHILTIALLPKSARTLSGMPLDVAASQANKVAPRLAEKSGMKSLRKNVDKTREFLRENGGEKVTKLLDYKM